MLAHDFGVAVNVFWRELDPKLYDTRDPYGNRYAICIRILEVGQ